MLRLSLIHISELSEEEIKRQEFLKKERIRSRERYQKLKSGERTVGAVSYTHLDVYKRQDLYGSGDRR